MIKRLYLVAILLALGAFRHAAAESRFQIEVIVFAQQSSAAEVFDQTQSEIQWPQRVVDVATLAPVAREHRILNDSYGALASSRAYRPLLQVSWIQQIAADQLGDAVRIGGGAIDGFIRLHRGRYLKLIADLEYNPDGRHIYRLQEKRRIKFNEPHYLDHPKFGVIAKVRPL